MAFDPTKLDPAGFNWGGAPPPGALATDEADNPTAEPIEDIDAQLGDLASDSERSAVYLSPDQDRRPQRTPEGTVTIDDFDGKGGTLIAQNQKVADKALKDQASGRPLQEIIGELTLAGEGKPSNPDALVVQKVTPDGAVMRESAQGTPDEAQAKAEEWGGGDDINFTDPASALERRAGNLGGTSERLAAEFAGGFRRATRESLDTVGKEMQAKNIDYLEEGPYSGLDFQEREPTGGVAGQRVSPDELDPEGFDWRGMNQPDPPKGEYGWGVGHAFKRGLLRAGQLIDLAQNDWEEYAEGEESLKKYEVSAEDAERLEELQESDGFWDAIGYYIKNPALAMQVVAESLPMSVPTLIGGAAGAMVGGPAGAMAGAGAGSFTVEYLASISEAFAEGGVDTTNPEELKAAFANEELMADARERATKRGIGVGMFDALSMGLAGRIYKPAKALTGAATKTGAVVGGTSEILAQGFAGAGGELTAQDLAGDERDWPAAASEFVGELVPGLGEMAISKIGRTQEDVPDTGGTTPIPPTDEGGAPITEQEAAEIDAASEAANIDIDAEAADRQVETPPPESETAATSKPSLNENAPAAQEETSEVVEEVSVEDMLKKAADEEAAAEEVETVSPLIDTKALGPKVTATITSNETPTPMRNAWRSLMQTLAKRYPDTAAKVPARTFGGAGVAKFFKQLQDDVDLTTELPELKTFLDEVTTGKPAEVIRALENLANEVRASTPSLADAPIDSIAGQVQAEYNNFMEYYETHQRISKAKKTKGQANVKGSLIAMANKLGEFSAAVRALLTAAEDAGVLEEAGIGANYGKTMELADQISDAAQSPIEKKTSSGGKAKTISYTGPTLLKVANNLKDIAEKVTPLLATAEAVGTKAKANKELPSPQTVAKQAEAQAELESLSPKKPKGKAKVESTSSATEAPAKPKKAEKAKKVSKAKVEKKVAPKKAKVKQLTKDTNTRINPETGVLEALDEFTGLWNPAEGVKESHPFMVVAAPEETSEGHQAIGIGVAYSPHRTLKDAELAIKKLRLKGIQGRLGIMDFYGETTYYGEQRKASSEEVEQAYKENKKPKKAEKAIKAGQIAAERNARIDAVVAKTDKYEAADAAWDLGTELSDAPINKLRKIAKTIGAKTTGKKSVLVDNITEVANKLRIERQNKSMAAEDAEIKADVEKHVPKKFRSKHVFHAVRSVKDIAAIVKSGIKKGTNLALDLMGQGVSMLGDVGTTVLVFKDDKAAYTVKGYQNDGVAKGGMKPVAIITDETDAKVLAELGKTGLPVYSNGKQVAAKGIAAKKPKKKTKKPDVKGAAPADVFDKEQNITGREATELKESVDAETLDEAFEKAGVSKSAAKRIRGIMAATEGDQRDALKAAAYEYLRKGDKLRFATQVEEIVGKVPSPELLEAYTEFTLAMRETAEQRRAYVAEEETAAQEDAYSFLSDDEKEIARLTGAIDPTFDPDEATVDEFNVPWSERLRAIFGVKPNRTPAERAQFNRDQRQLSAVINKVALKLKEHTQSSLIADQGLTPNKISMQELISLMLSAMPENHRFTHLFKLLKKTGLNTEVKLFDSVFGVTERGAAGEFVFGSNKGGGFAPSKSLIKLAFHPETQSATDFIKTMLHEMIHAASAVRYMADTKFRNHINELWAQAVAAYAKTDSDFPPALKMVEFEQNTGAATDTIIQYLSQTEGQVSKFYGLTNPLEFMAEAFTNTHFQNFLATVELTPSKEFMPSVMRKYGATSKFAGVFDLFTSFLRAVKKVVGVSMRNTVLEEVLSSTAANFSTPISNTFAKLKITVGKPLPSIDETVPDKKVRTTLVNNTADAARNQVGKVQETYETLADRLRALPRALNLGFMNRDVIERNYRDLFNRASKAAGYVFSPLTQYIKAKQAASQLAERFAKRAAAELRKMQKLDNKTRSKVMEMMRDTTLAQVWPHVALTHNMNAHLWGKPNKKGVSKLSPTLGEAAKNARKRWVALNRANPEAAKLLIDMAMLTREIQDQKRIEALRTVGKTYRLDAAIIKQLATLETKEDIQKMFPGMYDKEGGLIDTSEAAGNRPSDTVHNKKDSKEVKEKKTEKYNQWKDARSIAQTAEELVKGSSIAGPYFPLRRYGKYVVSSTEGYNDDHQPYVSFHHTRKEARRVAAALAEKHDMSTTISKKIESMAIARDVQSVAGELASRLEGNKNDHMHKRLQTAMLEIMADNTAYASQLKRHGVDGVAADDMGRAFEEYVFVAKYTLGDIATAFEVHQSLKDLKKLQTAEELTESELDTIGDVVTELGKQNKEDAKDREMSKFQKGVGLIGFFNFLGAPSYWILNATQTLTVTLPYIGSKWGAKGTVAYTESAGTIFKAMRAAMKSKDSSYEGFKAKLPPAAQKVVAELEAQGIIQATIAHQFGDIMTPSTLTAIQEWAGPLGKATATALKLMETIPEGVEKYNRISTALAIYNLSNGDIQAVADGVQATQFNYDSANRARLMKSAPGWAGGGLRAVITPMMMFKSYGVGLSRLLYGGMMDSMLTKRAHESPQQAAARRSEARKLAGGLIVSHSVFGGVAGGMMMAPVQALVWAFNEAFREAGDEFDPEEAVELYLQDVANDMVAALASRGLPAALGVDMSKSINLGNLLWMGNDRINMSDAGGVETAMVTALGPVAQYAVTTVREGHRLWTGDNRANWYDFAAAAIPLKMARGAIRGMKYEMEGIGTDTLTFVEPEDVTGWIRSAMGFRPTNVAMTTDFEYNLMGRENRRSTRKSQLINRALKADSASERAAVWADIQSFNRSLEKRGDYINRGDVVRLKSRRRTTQRQYNRERR